MVELFHDLLRGLAGLVGLELAFVNAWEAIRDFLELGGDVLLLIGLLLIVMWVLIVERLFYFYGGHRRMVNAAIERWENRAERRSWYAHRVREALISEVKLQINRSLPMIQALVALCPLLGLLGTVTGMVAVFEVMAVAGTGNPRSMAAGVSQATVPTMAGMVAALSGVFMSFWLQRKADREVELLAEHLTMDH